MNTLRRTIHPEVRIADSAKGIVDYIASDETLDSYREVIRSSGWRFTHFTKNAPFVDSHDYSTIKNQVGRVIDFNVEKGRLIERVQWAIDVAGNDLAQLGWKMTEAGYLRAVSVGFWPKRQVNKWDPDKSAWVTQLTELGLREEDGVRTIYIEQEQVELSAVILGANPNALAKAYKAGALSDADLDKFSAERSKRETACTADDPAVAEQARQRARRLFLLEIQTQIKKL